MDTSSPLIISRSCRLSRDRKYRYLLEQHWSDNKPGILFIGLNPSLADHKTDDPTVRKFRGFAQRLGFGSMSICNLFAYRSPSPKELMKLAKSKEDIIGPKNKIWLRKALREHETNCLCFGNIQNFLRIYPDILKPLKIREEYYYLRRNKNGMPSHPLYLPYSCELKKSTQILKNLG